MALYQNDELEYLVDNYFGMEEFENDGVLTRENHLLRDSDSGSDDEEFDSGKQKTDTSASEARNGKDIQGIPWERMNFPRDKYRELRLKQYNNFVSLGHSLEKIDEECKPVQKRSAFYDFQFNTRLVKSTIVHFQCKRKGESERLAHRGTLSICLEIIDFTYFTNWQLRNLVWATSKHDVYLMQNYSVLHWSSLLRRSKEVLNVAGHISPVTKRCGSQHHHSVSRVQVSTMSVKDNLMVAGGFQGEVICKILNHPGISFCSKVTDDENAITNAVDICRSPSGEIRLVAANNDCQVRVFDIPNFALLSQFSFPWSVNNISGSPDGKLLAVLGDSTDCLLADAQSGRTVASLKGHLDYSFSSDWHPDGRILATGNQDKSCRLWDVRNLSRSFAVLKGRMAAIRAIKFTSDGKFMAMAEPADFVHIFDTEADYSKAQEIDLFGEIAGISFSPDADAFYVGIADRTYGSLLEFKKKRQYQYLDCLL